nr:immunoglobulin light chain junction region [Macaca mulatta]
DYYCSSYTGRNNYIF